MSEAFKQGAMDRLLDRVEQDETGELRVYISQLMEIIKSLSKQGIPMDEIASVVTMFWYVGQNPEMEVLMEAFKGLDKSDEKIYN